MDPVSDRRVLGIVTRSARTSDIIASLELRLAYVPLLQKDRSAQRRGWRVARNTSSWAAPRPGCGRNAKGLQPRRRSRGSVSTAADWESAVDLQLAARL